VRPPPVLPLVRVGNSDWDWEKFSENGDRILLGEYGLNDDW
jgi:hypothetical protein